MIRLAASINEFEWSEDEQVWPFEKDKDGNTLYCKQIDFGSLTNNTYKNVSHGITGFTDSHIFRIEGKCFGPGECQDMPGAGTGGLGTTGSTVYVRSTTDMTAYTAFVRLIYRKA